MSSRTTTALFTTIVFLTAGGLLLESQGMAAVVAMIFPIFVLSLCIDP
jgi:hypothetical protein